MTQNIPARRPADDAKVGDIVQSHNDPGKAMWKVEAVNDWPSRTSSGRKVLDLRSLTSNRRNRRSTTWLDILSPEEVARVQAKKAPKPAVSDATHEAVAEAIALWDYKTATGEDPDSDESIVLPPHREIAGEVVRIVTGAAA